MKIAWFTPFNRRSAIGHYSEAIARYLARRDEIVLYVSDARLDSRARPTALPFIPLGDGPPADLLSQLDWFDAVVYNMGDDLISYKRIYEVLMRRPGVVVLHDLVLRDFFRAYFLDEKGDPEGLARRMNYSEGPGGAEACRAYLEDRPDGPADDAHRLRFPMFKAVLRRCLGVIVHSEHDRRRVAEVVGAPVAKLDGPPDQGPGEARRRARARFNTAAYCTGFRAFLDVVLFRKPFLSLADDLSDRLVEFGPHCPDGLVERLAGEVAVMAGSSAESAA